MSATEHRDPFTRWQAGHSRIVQAELAGEVVPPKWDAALNALDDECKAIEDQRRAAQPQQARLGGVR